MLNNTSMGKLESERLKHFPNVDSLLKISLGLILFTIISSALVYAETMSVNVEGNSFDVEYTATGISVSGIEADTESFSLILTVVADSSGTLDITFDRSFFDSIYQELDDEFFVLIDQDFADFTETETTSQSRTLSIEVPSGTEDIEIIGSVFAAIAAEEAAAEEAAAEEAAAEEAAAEEAAAEEAAAKEAAAKEAAAKEAAAKEAAAKEAAAKEAQKTQCGPGTVLKDGVCVLDERCGPGTVLKDGVCVLDSSSQSPGTSVKGIGKELIVGVAAAFVIAGIIGIILGLISKASKSRD